ncbi:hypothetical protein [Micromonospora chersina]|uniref:hypothetical protein n=1 Tax=Micromonospora chersina TaxID=47854 RepID=UPI003D8BE140
MKELHARNLIYGQQGQGVFVAEAEWSSTHFPDLGELSFGANGSRQDSGHRPSGKEFLSRQPF